MAQSGTSSLRSRKKRKKRKGELVCTCRAYKFPHRMMGGRCAGYAEVEEIWEANYGGGDCRQCNYLQRDMGYYCEVVEGQEPPWECPVFAEKLHRDEVPVPKKLEFKSWV